MDDSRIPGWLVLLLGIAVAGLAVWQSSRWKQQLRIGAGSLGLVYLGLLAYAIGGDSRGGTAARVWQFPSPWIVVLSGLSLTAAVLLVGRPTARGQLLWFAVLSLSNAAVCFVWGAFSPGILLTIVAVVAAGLLLVERRRGSSMQVAELWPAAAPDDESPYLVWLVGGTGFVLAVALVGVSYYALRAESSRAIATRRHSALPAQARLRAVLNIQPEHERADRFVELALGPRADVIVLLVILAFIALASGTSTGRARQAAMTTTPESESVDQAT